MLKTFTLKNGIKIATYNLPALKSVHIKTSVKGGALTENPKKNGVAHFMEHMLVQGIPSLTNVEQFSSFIEGLAGSYGASTDTLLVNFYMSLPATKLEDGIKISSEVIFNPLFVEEALEKERRAVITEIMQRADSHWYKISQFIKNERFKGKHLLKLDAGGSLETVQKITRDDLIEYFKQFFVSKNTYLLIVGNFSEIKLKKYLNTYFEKNNSKNSFSGFPKFSSEDFSDRKVVLRKDENLKTCYLDLNFPAISLDDSYEKLIKQSIALVILGKLRNSRLFKLLRYQKGLVYGVTAGVSTLPGLGFGYISSEVSRENLEEVVDLIAKELKAYVQNGPTAQELEFAKNYLTNQWFMSFDHPSSIADWIGSDLLWRDKIQLPEELVKEIKDLTTEDLTKLMQKEWDFGKLNLVIQGDIENNKLNREKFSKILKELK